MASALPECQISDARAMTSLPNMDAASWVLRHHSPCAITALSFYKGSPDDGCRSKTANQASNDDGPDPDSSSDEDEDDTNSEDSFLLIGDATGKVSLTSLRTHRPLLHWQAHRPASSILGVQAWMEEGNLQILTHGRDNSIKIWKTNVHSEQQRRRQEAYTGGRKEDSPELILTLDVNALNFCRFSILVSSIQGSETLLAVPHTVESGYIDLYQLPAKRRLYSSIGSSQASSQQNGRNRPAIVMSMHLFRLPSVAQEEAVLGIVAGYEDGTLRVWIEPQSTTSKQDTPSSPWRCLWKKRLHAESILSIAMRATSKKDGLEVVSVGADDRICYVELPFRYLEQASRNESETMEPPVVTNKTDKPGRGSCAFLHRPSQASQEVSFVVGGWDGRGRVYRVDRQTEEMSCQGVLRYHREDCSIQAVAAGQASRQKGGRGAHEEQGFIALGGKDGRVSLWM